MLHVESSYNLAHLSYGDSPRIWGLLYFTLIFMVMIKLLRPTTGPFCLLCGKVNLNHLDPSIILLKTLGIGRNWPPVTFYDLKFCQ